MSHIAVVVALVRRSATVHDNGAKSVTKEQSCGQTFCLVNCDCGARLMRGGGGQALHPRKLLVCVADRSPALRVEFWVVNAHHRLLPVLAAAAEILSDFLSTF